jgi:hypothetical protein
MPTSIAFGLAARAVVQDAAVQAAFHKSTVESWALYAIGVAATLLRTYARGSAVGFRHLQADDYLVWVGIVCAPAVDPTARHLVANLHIAVILHCADGSCVQRG